MKYNKTKIVLEWNQTKGVTSLKHHVVGKALPKRVKKMLLNTLLTELKMGIRID